MYAQSGPTSVGSWWTLGSCFIIRFSPVEKGSPIWVFFQVEQDPDLDALGHLARERFGDLLADGVAEEEEHRHVDGPPRGGDVLQQGERAVACHA